MACFQASSICRYSVILFWRFLAAIRLSGEMFSSPMNTRRQPARAAFSMKLGIRWTRVSTWMIRRMLIPSPSRSSISRSKIGSQSLLRAKLSSVMKKRKIPWATLARTIRSTSSGVRRRLLRPCTLMMVQNEHWNGQPRPASKLVLAPKVLRTTEAGRCGVGMFSRLGRSFMKL